MFDLPSLETIVHALKSLNMAQRDLAKLAGVGQATLSKMLKGSDVRYSTVWRVMRALQQAMRQEPQRTAGDISSRDLVSVEEMDLVRDALVKMRGGVFDQLPVFDGRGELVGTITDSDLMEAVNEGVPYDELIDLPVHDVMGQALPVVENTEPVTVVQFLLLHHPAVLVRSGGKIHGIITWADVLDPRKQGRR